MTTQYYALLQYNEEGGVSIAFYETTEDRDRATLLAIYGELTAEADDTEHNLGWLRARGVLEFEGDPRIEWKDITDIWHQPKGDSTLYPVLSPTIDPAHF